MLLLLRLLLLLLPHTPPSIPPQAWLREPEWRAIEAALQPTTGRGAAAAVAAGEVPLAPGAAAVAYCVARAYLVPTDLRYVRPLAGRLLGSDAPKTLWMLDGYDELDAAEGMAADLREAALAALTVRKQTAAAAGRQGMQAAVATADDDEPAPPGEAGGAAAAAAGADPSAAEPLNPTAAAAAAAAAAAPTFNTLTTALRLLISQAHTAVTTRPAFATSIGCSSYVRLEPLARADVADFAARALGGTRSRAWGRLQERMASSAALADALRTPVIMQVGEAGATGQLAGGEGSHDWLSCRWGRVA